MFVSSFRFFLLPTLLSICASVDLLPTPMSLPTSVVYQSSLNCCAPV
jgi:hypothetical protein